MGDRFLAQFPAQQHHLTINFTRKIQQAYVEVFHLYADSRDLIHCVFDPLKGLFALGFASCQMNDVDGHSAIHENAMSDRLQFGVDGLDQLLAIEGFAQKRFKYWQEILRFVESEGAGRHGIYTLVAHSGAGAIAREQRVSATLRRATAL